MQIFHKHLHSITNVNMYYIKRKKHAVSLHDGAEMCWKQWNKL